METEIPRPAFTLIDKSLRVKDNHLIVDNQTVALLEVTAIRYGWEPIMLDMYTIGTHFTIEVKTPETELKLNFKSYFGIAKKKQHEKYIMLLNAIWDPTVIRLIDEMIDNFERGITTAVGSCKVIPAGILYKDFPIEWNDLTYQKNYNKLTINSKSNPNVWTNLYYTQTDNVHILMYFLDWKFETENS